MTSKEYNSRCTSEARNKRSSWNIGMDTTSSAISVSSPCSSLVSEEESSSICLSRLSFVTASRIVFIFCLAGVAAVLGYSADRLLSDAEVTLACEQFKAISGRALKATVEITKRQGMGAATLASVASTAFPDADMWPNVKINGFEKVSNNIIATSNGRSMGLLPLVTEDQLGDFEAFLYDEVIAKNCPNGTGVHSFGKGVNGNNPALNTSDNLYHETDGETYWGSPYHVMTPYLYHSYGCAILTFNLHSYEIFGRVIDDVITCSKERANLLWEQRDEEGPEEEANIECSTLSDLTFLYGQAKSSKSTPAAVLIQAIHPENDNRELVGMISSTIEWSDILFNVFSSRVIGIDCVLETDTKAYTYQIQHGIATTR